MQTLEGGRVIPDTLKGMISATPGQWLEPVTLELLRECGNHRETAQELSRIEGANISFSEAFDTLKPKNGQVLTAQLPDSESEDNPFQIIDISAWQKQTPPERQWCLPNWIPKGVVTGLGGAGGASKSTLALQLCIHQGLGWPILGEKMQQAPALFLTCEDDKDELHRRTQAIATAMGVQISDFAEHLHLIDRVGEDAVLVEPIGGLLARTPLYHQLDQMLGDLKIDLCALDLLPDFWVGNENDRGQVNALVKNHLANLAKRHQLGLMALYHPSLGGMNSGTGTSGSTAWDGSFRSRLYLEFEAESNTRTLSRKKANYAALEDLELVWRNGYLIEPSSLHESPEDERTAKWETDFLTALEYCDKNDIEISAATNSKDYYGKVFPAIVKQIDGRRRWATATQFNKAYYRALATGTICEAQRTNTTRRRLHFKGYSNAR